MDCKERVRLAIEHKISDKVPKGELEIDKTLRKKLLGEKLTGDDFIDEVGVRKLLGMDTSPLVYLDRPEEKILKVETDGQKIVEDIWGNQYLVGKDTIKLAKSAINNIKEIYTYQFPSLENFSNVTMQKWLKKLAFLFLPSWTAVLMVFIPFLD